MAKRKPNNESSDPMSQGSYAANGGEMCPFCSNEDLIGESINIDSGSATQEVFCTECEKTWFNEYRLVGYTPIEEPK